MDELWKPISNYKHYEVSNLGNIRRKNKFGNYELVKPRDNCGYNRITIYNVYNIDAKSCYVHRLVAEAWLVNDSAEKDQINHIDGNKKNNAVYNLEWVTGKENVQHAFDAGLRTDRYGLVLVNIVNGEERYFNSFKQAAGYLGIGSDTFVSYIKRSETYPIFEKYIVILNDNVLEKMMNIKKSYPKRVFVYDHVNDLTFDYKSVALASVYTGVSNYSVREALGSKNIPVYYVGGYSYSYLPKFDVVSVSKEKAQADRDMLWSKPIITNYAGIEIYNYDTKEITTYKNRNELAKALDPNNNVNAVTDAIGRSNKKNRTWLYKGYGIRVVGSDLPWYPYNKAQLLCSKNNFKFDTPVFHLAYENGDEEYVFTSTSLSTRFNININTISGYLVKKKDLNKLINRTDVKVSLV